MAIVVKHSGNIAPTLVAAFGGGVGKRRKEDSDIVRDQNFRAAESRKARAFSAEQSALAKQEADRVALRNREWDAEDAAAGAAAKESALMRGREWEQSDAATAFDRQKEMVEYGISEKQRQDRNARWEAYEAAVASKEYTPEEVEAIRENMKRLAGMTKYERSVEFLKDVKKLPHEKADL